MYREITDESKYVGLLQKKSDLPPGKAHLATRFVDYSCESASFASVVYAVAAQRRLKVTCTTFENHVVYVFYDPYGYWMPHLKNFPIVKKMRREA